MSPRTLLALLATVALSSVTSSAGADDERAYIKVKNDSTWSVDCRVFWGNQTVAFNGTAPSSTTEAKQIAISPTERVLVCKKTGVAPTPAVVSAPLKFKVESTGDYTITCAHKSDASGLSCSVATPAPKPAPGVRPGLKRREW